MTIDWWTLALQAANVLILVWLLARFFWKPVAGMIAERRDGVARTPGRRRGAPRRRGRRGPVDRDDAGGLRQRTGGGAGRGLRGRRGGAHGAIARARGRDRGAAPRRAGGARQGPAGGRGRLGAAGRYAGRRHREPARRAARGRGAAAGLCGRPAARHRRPPRRPAAGNRRRGRYRARLRLGADAGRGGGLRQRARRAPWRRLDAAIHHRPRPDRRVRAAQPSPGRRQQLEGRSRADRGELRHAA